MGVGSSPYGSVPFGSTSTGYNLVSVSVISTYVIDLVFDEDVDFGLPAATDPSNYSFSGGLTAISAIEQDSNVVRVLTTQQIVGVEYTVFVNFSVLSILGSVLVENSAQFISGIMPDYAVSDLVAKTHCNGRRIDLFWTNPTTPTPAWIRIVRRQRNWIFDLTDAHDVVYDGEDITSFFDTGITTPTTSVTADVAIGATSLSVDDETGFNSRDILLLEQLDGVYTSEEVVIDTVAVGVLNLASPTSNSYLTSRQTRVSISTPLLPQTYYYYSVLVSDVVSPIDSLFTLSDSTRVAGLSIKSFDSKENFFWENTPEYLRVLDETIADNFLDNWYDILGCWLNILRGSAKARILSGDGDETPYNTLSAKVLSLGVEPEGFSYDYEIPRRTLQSLINVFQRRGTCTGLVRAARMFTKWDATCVEFGLGDVCRDGAQILSTWNGTAQKDEGSGDSAVITLANRTLTDIGNVYTSDQWQDGFVVGAIGDIACVESNTPSTMTFKQPSLDFTIDGTVGVGATTIPVDSTAGLTPGLTVQLEQESDPTTAEIVEVNTVTPGVSFTIKEPTINSYAAGDFVTIGKSLIRGEFLGSGGTWSLVSGSTYEMNYPEGGWVENQWVGYKILLSDNDLRDITSNTSDALQVEGALPTDGAFAIAKDFTVGGSFATRDPVVTYTVYSAGEVSNIFEPTLDLETKGTIHDPLSYLWMGLGVPVYGVWGPGDVGIYIQTQGVIDHFGRGISSSGPVGGLSTFDLDPTVVAPAVNQYAGYFLNPNQNQTQLFRITSNTATTVTIEGDINSLVVPGQIYYILSERNATAFKQLTRRFGPPLREFAHADANVRVLFV